jgi:pyridoxal phosphate enzyme (YggS family)
MSIKNNLQELKNALNKEITLVAVSKTKPISAIQEAYNAGQRIFGENKVQEMADKYEKLPKDIKWHMIGHLQRNKIKYMAHFVDLIHGVDSFKTLKEINKQAKKHDRIIHCLLQVKIATEETKFGLTTSKIESILNNEELKTLENINISGFMGMASFTLDKTQVSNEFNSLKTFFETSKNVFKTKNIQFKILSKGMSGDYKIAIENGSNMIRAGSAIFGSRNY